MPPLPPAALALVPRQRLLLVAWMLLMPVAGLAESPICESYRTNYAREQASIDQMKTEPYKANRQRALDEKRARLERECARDEAFAAGDGRAPVPADTAAEPGAGSGSGSGSGSGGGSGASGAGGPGGGSLPGRPPLQGGTRQTVLTGGVDQSGTDTDRPPVLTPEVPQLDPRGAPAPGTGGDSSRSTGDVNGTLLPRTKPAPAGGNGAAGGDPGIGRGGSGSRTTTSVTGTILGSSNESPPGDDQVRETARRLSAEGPDAAARGPAVNNDFTRSYFFTQGVLHGLLDGASEASGAMARTQVAAYYLMTGRPVEAQRVLGYTGRDSVIRDMQQDLQDWQTVATTTTDPYSAYANGRTAGRLLGKSLTQKFTDQVGHAGHLPTPPDAAVSPPKH
ncbi:MAG: hypothetical protein R3E87_11955 [Burkholderiaceae bacterium]